jgi:trk system potassium uptake protein TrkA
MKVIIIGCGRMGSGLAQVLGMRGHDLTLVDNDPAAFARLGPTFTGKTIQGFGFDQDVLLEAGIKRADGVAAVTGSDEVNVVVARLARQWFHVPRVVARLYDPRKAEIYRRLGIATVAPVNWGITRMADSLVLAQLNTLCSLGDAEIEIVELEIPPLLIGRTVRDLAVPGEIQVLAIRRCGKTTLALPGVVFEAGDVLYVTVLATAIDRLKAMVGLS